MRSFVVVASAVAAALLPRAAAARSRTSFDFGWKFVLGDQGFKPDAETGTALVASPLSAPSLFCEFNKNITGTQCFGLTSYPDASTIDECQAACCMDYTCLVWQWDAANAGNGPCWGGADCSNNGSSAGWTSFVRAPPSPPNPPVPNTPCTDVKTPCAQGFNDSAWRTVNTPHDFVVEGVPTESADRGERITGRVGRGGGGGADIAAQPPDPAAILARLRAPPWRHDRTSGPPCSRPPIPTPPPR